MERGLFMKGRNPIIWSDFPDLDVIRVEDTYYMISTTMHFMPGGVILKSYDLINWEIESYVYDYLEDNEEHRLEDIKNIYGKGMWAASLRYHKGTFYVCFVANDSHKTYLFRSETIKGPWKRTEIEGFYHDSSLLFDDDGRIYIIYGNKNIYLTELNKELTGPKQGGIHKIIITDTDNVTLGYEGAHFYKINGKYYVFLIHWPRYGACRRTEACYVSDTVDGEYSGGEVLNDDMGYLNAGVAQGGIVDTPDGDWYAMLFQDHGAVGRIPVLIPVTWVNDFPVFGTDGKVPVELEVKSTRPDYIYRPLMESDDFKYEAGADGCIRLKDAWQWNHKSNSNCWSVTDRKGWMRITTSKTNNRLVTASNVLTQRTMGPECEGTIRIDGRGLKDGDYAGLAALQGCYGMIALTREEDKFYLVMKGKERKEENPGEQENSREWEYARIPVESPDVYLKVSFDFRNNIDIAEFYYLEKDEWVKLGKTKKLYFLLDHFVGSRFALFVYSTIMAGGCADFTDFKYIIKGE